MAKEKWLIDPGELDEFQRNIRGLSINDSYAVKGCAGSGKTILALYRANDIRLQALAEDEHAYTSFTMVVFTKALRSFIRSGIQDLGIDLKQVIHFEKWDASEVDYIVVDEAQDFTKEEIEIFSTAYRKSIMFYGDSQQQLYNGLKTGGVLSIEGIAAYLGLEEMELSNNYRLPRAIASFASHLSDDPDLEKKCVKEAREKPAIRKFASWKAELDFIINEIKTRNFTDVGILLPFNISTVAPRNNIHRNVQTVKEYFEEKAFAHEFKVRIDDNDNMELDFDSDLPKVMTFHSSKGLQFETVFIPFFDAPEHDQWFQTKYRSPYYVGLTRTYMNLYLTHSERLSPFISVIPPSKSNRY